MTGANRPDMEVVEATPGSIPVDRPEPTGAAPPHLCADRGYDFPSVRELVGAWGYTAHIPVTKAKGAAPVERKKIPGYRAEHGGGSWSGRTAG